MKAQNRKQIPMAGEFSLMSSKPIIVQEPKGNLLYIYQNGKILCTCLCQQYNPNTTAEMKRQLIESKNPCMVSQATLCRHIKKLIAELPNLKNYEEI